MKKINYILYFIFIILLYHLTKNNNIFLLTISFSLFIIFNSIFSSINIKDTLSKYYDNKYYYSVNKIFKYSIIYIFIIYLFIIVISFGICTLLNIDNLFIVNIFMTIFSLCYILIKVISEYLIVIEYKKLGNILSEIYLFINVILYIIISIILYKLFNFNNYINIIILYSIGIFTFIFISILLYFLIFKKIKKYNKKREELKINHINKIRNIIVSNNNIVIFNIIKNIFVYLSIIFLYYVLLNKYYYSYDKLTIYINNIYFYGIIFVYYIYLIIKNIYIKDFNTLKDNIINKNNPNFNNFINKIIKVILPLCILLIILSGPISYILFKENIIINIVPLIFFYILYNIIININIICNKDKSILIILLSGLLVTILSEVPLINAMYRMGYELILGSILSIILGLMTSIILGIILIKNKLKIPSMDNFNNILNIIYENILYTLVLVVFTFVVKVNTTTYISSILVIIFYIIITIIFNYIKGKIKKNIQ